MNAQIANGVGGVIVGGTTGEGQLMSWDEHIMLIAHTIHNFGDKLMVIGNTGSNSTSEALHATEQGFAIGMHAALQINPYYGKTSHAGLRAHFNAVLAEGPAIVYNVSVRWPGGWGFLGGLLERAVGCRCIFKGVSWGVSKGSYGFPRFIYGACPR